LNNLEFSVKNILTLLMVLALTSCASTEVIEARKAAIDKADHEECLSFGFTEDTEAYGGCRLTLKSIRAQEENTDALQHNRRVDFRWCRGFYC
jgi:hypothetical protein